jgi:N-acetyl sugar amidotransferase
VLPDTRPNLRIAADGRCNACHLGDSKIETDWDARERQFRELVSNAVNKSQGYDCVIPVSGGKDSTWQVVRCLEFGLTPLAVTWRTPARTEVGQKNLDNLVTLGVDHVDYQINPTVERRFMLQCLKRYGSTAIPMHLALFNIPMTIAVNCQIPLVIWGENSAFEYGNADDAHLGLKLDRRWLERYGVTHGTTAIDWVGAELTRKDLAAYFGPDPDAVESLGVRAMFLGHYFPWDPQTSLETARTHGFQSNPDGARTGYYDYADIDDDFISIHHWLKWYKFGFTRLFDNLSLEIRNKRLTREQAIETIRNLGDQTPHTDIGRFCEFVDIDVTHFFEICERFRNPEVWNWNGRWEIDDFLIPDWNWDEIYSN